MQTGDYWKGWEVVELLGSGSYGNVFRIVRRGYNGFTEESALKVIRIPKDPSDFQAAIDDGMTEQGASSYFESLVDDFSKEFKLMSRLKGNSNIVSFEDYEVARLTDDFGWEIFIRMELLTPLSRYIKQNSITESDVARLGVDICKALELCEAESILHRDIKPQNIFVSKHGDFKLGDFGIARKLENVTLNMTRIGSPSYMAPEVYKGDQYTSNVDTYSLGLVLYRLLNNNRGPFMPLDTDKIKYTDREEARAKRLSGDPLPWPVNASNEMAAVVLKASAYNPEDRYQNASEMRSAIEDILASAGHENILSVSAGRPSDEKTEMMIDDNNVSVNDPAQKIFGKFGKKKTYIVIAIMVAFVIAAASGAGTLNKNEELANHQVIDETEETDEIGENSDADNDNTVGTELVSEEESEIVFPEYDGGTIQVSTADELMQALRSAADGTTIELASGEYSFNGPISVNSSNIRLLGVGDTQPIIDCGISVGGNNVTLENLSVNVTDAAKADGGEMGRCVYFESLSGGDSYMKDCTVTLRYHGDNIQYGVELTSPLYMRGCTIDVSDTNDDNWSGYICVGMGSKFVPENCIFRSNDVALGLWPVAEDEYTEEDYENILNNNVFKASMKISK